MWCLLIATLLGVQNLVVCHIQTSDNEMEQTPTNSITKRRPNRSLPDNCFTLDDINALVADMKDVANFQFSPGQPTVQPAEADPTEVIVDATECEQARINVWTQFSKLAELHIILRQEDAILSTAQLEKVKKQYEIEKEKYRNATDILKPQLSKEGQKKFEELEQQQQNMEQKLNSALKDMENLSIEHKRNLVFLSASELDSGRIDSAVEKFHELEDQDQLYAIVLRVYNPGMVENIIKFIEKLPWLSHRAYGYDALLSQMEEHRDLNNPNLLTLQYYLLRAANSSQLGVNDTLLQSAEERVAKYIENAIGSFVEAIRVGNYQPVIDFSSDNFTEGAFSAHLQQIVRSAYNYSKNDNIIQLAEKLNNKVHAAHVYVGLYKQMQVHDQLNFKDTLKIALRVKVLLRVSYLRGILLKFSFNLPTPIRAITWGKACIQYFKNKKLYLCSDETQDASSTKRKVFLCENQHGWIFDPFNDGEYFHLRPQADLDEYLHVINKNHGVYTRQSPSLGDRRKWSIINNDWKKGEFNLYSHKFGENLTYQDSFSHNKVRTTLNNNDLGNPEWSLIIC